MNNKTKKPKILQIETVAKSNLFSIESVKLKFNNGKQCIYERINPSYPESIMVIPIINNCLLIVKEYNVGIEDYELGFPKGSIKNNEILTEAANRELKEEIGFGAKFFTFLYKLSAIPSYFSSKTHILVAQGLYSSCLEGDEPESLKILHHPLDNLFSLLKNPNFCEARNVSALFFLHFWLQNLSKEERKFFKIDYFK